MLAALLRLSVERRWLMLALVLAAAAVGAWHYQLLPIDAVPARFDAHLLYEETFVIAARKGHPALRRDLDVDTYCGLRHLVVSMTGDPHGFVDNVLAAQGKQRRVALTVPNFLFALSVLADSDMVSALPRSFVAAHGKRFGVAAVEAPFAMPVSRMRAVVSRAAAKDAGVAWLAAAIRAPDWLGATSK